MLRFAMLLALGTLPLGTLYSQAMTPPAPGSQVRIRTVENRNWQTGKVKSVDDSTIVLLNRGGGEMRMPLQSVTAIDVSDGHRSRWRGAAIGLVVGGGVGAVLGYSTGECSSAGFCLFTPAESAMLLGTLGGVAGTGIGALVGGGERWKRAAIPSRVSISPMGTKGLRVDVAF